MAKRPDVIVIGGGVIGCGIAYELAKRNAGVLVLERDTLGSGASQASGGMLAPLSDALVEHPLMDLAFESFRSYPAFIEEVEDAAGFQVDHLRGGIVRVALDEADERALREQLAWAPSRGIDVRWLDAGEALELEPLLSPSIRGASHSPGESQLHPGRLVEALRRAALAHRAEFRELTPVHGLTRSGPRVTGVRTATDDLEAGHVVITTGAWGRFAGEWLETAVPTEPVRGQVVYVDKLSRPLRHIVMRGDSYAVPRADGTTLVGCTREHAGFEQRVTVAGMASILTRIQDLIPAVGETTVNHTRAGLRPGIVDHVPALGPLPGVDNVTFAVGHDRSGILLTPITAKMIASSILDGAADFGAFAASRFAEAAP